MKTKILIVSLFFSFAGCGDSSPLSKKIPSVSSAPMQIPENGGWISSGGEIFRPQSHNPWFVQNTTQVKYCISRDAEGISVSLEKIRENIQEAIFYWKTQFTHLEFTNTTSFQVATQEFLEVDCSANPDLRFLFGYSTLNPAELHYIGDAQSYVGIAVRTNYDPVNLKGRGFVFISSDQGPHRYAGENLVDQAWQSNDILRLVLVHELGHIFGLPHLADGIMSEQTPQSLLEQASFEANQRAATIELGLSGSFAVPISTDPYTEIFPSFFEPRRQFQIYQGLGSFFSEVTVDEFCLNFNFEKPYRSESNIVPIQDCFGKQVGELVLTGSISPITLQSPLELEINDQQQVFPNLSKASGWSKLSGPSFVALEFNADIKQYKPSRSKSVLIYLQPDGIKVFGESNGRTQVLVSSPFSKLGHSSIAQLFKLQSGVSSHGLALTATNIANANSPGYSSKSIQIPEKNLQQQTNPSDRRGSKSK